LSGDDDVAYVFSTTEVVGNRQISRDYFGIGNIVDTAILKAPPASRKRPLLDLDLQQKDPKARIPLNVEKGAIWVRKYKEATKTGVPLEGFQNKTRGSNAMKYYHLPQATGEPLEWWPNSAILGHVRMKRVDGVDNLCYDKQATDYKDLLKKYHDEMGSRKEVCNCKICNK